VYARLAAALAAWQIGLFTLLLGSPPSSAMVDSGCGDAMSTKKEETIQLEIKLRLPGSVAREAAAIGLLEPKSLESMLREELQRRRVDRLFEVADRLGSVPLPPLSDAEVEAEIRAVRSRRRTTHTGGR